MTVVCFVQCPGCENGRTILPRQSRLGTFRALPNPSKYSWPAMFLCRECERTSLDWGTNIRSDSEEVPAPTSGLAPVLWQIEYECVRENCGEPHVLYMRWLEGDSAESVSARAVKGAPSIPCKDGHFVQTDATKEPEVWPF